MKKSKLIIALLSCIILFSCSDNVVMDSKYVIVDSVKSINDSTFKVNLKCKQDLGKSIAELTTNYRYQAGDTMWTANQLKMHYEKNISELMSYNRKMSDSAFYYRISLGNKIDDLNKEIRDLQNQNNALQKALVKLK